MPMLPYDTAEWWAQHPPPWLDASPAEMQSLAYYFIGARYLSTAIADRANLLESGYFYWVVRWVTNNRYYCLTTSEYRGLLATGQIRPAGAWSATVAASSL